MGSNWERIERFKKIVDLAILRYDGSNWERIEELGKN